MHKESFIINCNTLLHVSTLLDHLQGEIFVIVTLRLHFIVGWECAVDCVLRTAHSHPTIKCNLSVTITKSSPWRWPSRVETCRSVLRLMTKLSLCILLVISVFVQYYQFIIIIIISIIIIIIITHSSLSYVRVLVSLLQYFTIKWGILL
jgi:hypothetical protein